MLKQLFIKDIRILIKDLKFQIFFITLLALFIVSAISSTVNYNALSEEYIQILQEHQTKFQNPIELELQRMIQDRQSITVVAQPSPAVLFSVNDHFPNRMTNNVMFFQPIMHSGIATTEVFRINWYFILSIMMSFIMLILSFEAVSSEKRSGTLRLLSIYGFKRQTILWSKYLSYMLLYFIIIIPSALISMVLFFALTSTWDETFMMKFISIILLSIPFASFFVLLGIFISTLKNYRNAIIIVVMVWLLVVIIIPQSANIFGEKISPIKTNAEYTQMQTDAWQSEWDSWVEKHGAKVDTSMEILEGFRSSAVYAADEKSNQINQQRLIDENRQWQTIRNIAKISPFTQFEEIANIIMDNGSYLYDAMLQTMRNSLSQIRNLIITQDSKDPTSLHFFHSWAGNQGIVEFTTQKFEHPELLLVTNIPTDDSTAKTVKILIKLLPILALNLLLIIGAVMRLERLDIR